MTGICNNQSETSNHVCQRCYAACSAASKAYMTRRLDLPLQSKGTIPFKIVTLWQIICTFDRETKIKTCHTLLKLLRGLLEYSNKLMMMCYKSSSMADCVCM
ncbi:hypothetical protein ACF0H5_009367 [Mactra antiquata]